MDSLISLTARRVVSEWRLSEKSLGKILDKIQSQRTHKFSTGQKRKILTEAESLVASWESTIEEWKKDFYSTIFTDANYHIVGVD